MIASVYLVAVLLVLTKLCDVVSTLQRVEHPNGETNPIARLTMLRIGTKKAVWGVFVLAMIIIGLSGWAALNGGKIMQAFFIVLGVVISIVQGSVAHCNWTGRDNVVTRRVSSFHAYLSKITSTP